MSVLGVWCPSETVEPQPQGMRSSCAEGHGVSAIPYDPSLTEFLHEMRRRIIRGTFHLQYKTKQATND